MARQIDTPPIADQVADALAQAQISATAAAKKAGLDKSYVGRIVSGNIKRPGAGNLRKLENALNLPSGNFRYPRRARVTVEQRLEGIDRRLESLEAALNSAASDAAQSFVGLTTAIDGLSAQLRALEQRAPRQAEGP